MLNLLRQSLLKLSQYGVKKFAEPSPNVLQKSDGKFRQVIHAAYVNKKIILKKVGDFILVGTAVMVASVVGLMSFAYIQVTMDDDDDDDRRTIYKKDQLKTDNIDNKKQS
ncbi:uncharacterized protein LOC122849743 isoform X2 [Aphidius gifuensis]|uniref:uncharacterized protein LOC122849743 isoform X2 n=1 Tax=Aphidius gifuensis TaxID=684658 RepID=UPI001CDB866F|nr:uncharacterized protein LOC122849743 isoform X2 [Aphidius gifuensis]